MSEPRKYKATGATIGKAINPLRSVLLVALAIYLTACGFHLRGQSSLPPKLESIHLLAENLNPRQRALLDQKLRRAGASLEAADNPEQVQLTVSISSLKSRPLADAAGLGKSIVRLSRQLTYHVGKANGERLIESNTLVQQLDIELDGNNLLDSDERIRRAEESLDQALIEQLIFGLGQR